MVHQAGYVYNDINPKNVPINLNDGGQPVATLIDMGLATKFLDENGVHIKGNQKVDNFHGNVVYSSLDSMNFHQTSRKDDMISLFLMMVYLINDN